MSLPVLNCDSCSSCCMEMGGPPFVGDDDEQRLQNSPQEARNAYESYLDRLGKDVSLQDKPCCWLDVESNRCRWHEHRPDICREFEVGGKYCLEWRTQYVGGG